MELLQFHRVGVEKEKIHQRDTGLSNKMKKTIEIPFDEQARLGYVYIVWGLTIDNRMDLVAICTDKAITKRYIKYNKLNGSPYRAVRSEKAFVNHLYGQGDLAIFNQIKR